MRKRIEQNLVESIHSAEYLSFPFPILLLDQVFPQDVYEALVGDLPHDSSYRQMYHPDAILPDRTSSRSVFELRGNGTDLWNETTLVLESTELESEVRRALKSEEIAPGYPRCALVRDREGFFIRPHPDASEKVITLQIYLARPGQALGLGTTFYDGETRAFFTASYRPNAGYAFLVSKKSWHGRERLPPLLNSRNTLSVTYYRNPGDGEFSYL